MKKIILFLLTLVALTACNSSRNNVPPDSEEVYSDFFLDISKLQSLNSSVTVDTNESVLDFGSTTGSVQTLSKVITLKNSASTVAAFTLGTLTDNVGFSIKINRCTGSVVPAKGSCQITIQFSARGLYTSKPSDYLLITAGEDSVSIQLKAEITNQPNPNTLEPSLVYSLSTTATGKVLTIKNNGPGDASDISPTIPSGYIVQLNRCGGILKSTKSCSITIVFKNYRLSPQPTSGVISVVARGSSENLPVASIDIVTGQVTIASTTPVITLARPPAGSIIMLLNNNGETDTKILCGQEGSGFDSCSYTGDEYNRSISETGGVIKLYIGRLPSNNPLTLSSSDATDMVILSAVQNNRSVFIFNGEPGFDLTISGLQHSQTLTLTQSTVPATLAAPDIYSATSNKNIAVLPNGSVKFWGGGAQQETVDALGFTSSNKVVMVKGNPGSFAFVLEDGTVKVIGSINSGGNQQQVDALGFNSSNKIVKLVSSDQAYAAVLQDGTLKVWGNEEYAGGSQSYVDSLNISPSNPVVDIASSDSGFAVVLQDGSVNVWGRTGPGWGTDPSQAAALNFGPSNKAVKVFSTAYSYAVLMEDGSVKGWGDSYSQELVNSFGFGPENKVISIYTVRSGFAALTEHGDIKVWGDGMIADQSVVDSFDFINQGVKKVYPGLSSIIVELTNGTLKGWGYIDGQPIQTQLDSKSITSANGVVDIVSTSLGYSILLQDGSVKVLGGSNNSQVNVDALNLGPQNKVVKIVGGVLFFGILENGKVVVWGSNVTQESLPAELR